MLLHRLSPICVSRSNSLIFNFANKKTSMARSTFKVLFYVNGSKEKDGIVPIMGRVTINGTVAQFSCKQTIPKTLWDAKGNRARGKSIEARDINHALDNIKAQIIKHYQRISDREAYVTAEMVRNAYQGIGSEYETLIKAFDKDCANFLKRVGKDRITMLVIAEGIIVLISIMSVIIRPIIVTITAMMCTMAIIVSAMIE